MKFELFYMKRCDGQANDVYQIRRVLGEGEKLDSYMTLDSCPHCGANKDSWRVWATTGWGTKKVSDLPGTVTVIEETTCWPPSDAEKALTYDHPEGSNP